MKDPIKLTADDFIGLENCRDPYEAEEQFKKELEELLARFKVKDYIISILYGHDDKNNAVTIVEAGDDFLSTHINVCAQALCTPGKPEKIN